MGHSYTELKRKFEEEWAKNLKLYIEAGMSQEFIFAIREFDEEAFRKERAFQNNTPARIEYWDDPRLDCIFRPSESKETVGVSPPSREKQVQVHGRESTGVLFWKEMAKERFAKRSSACHLFRLESFSFAHGVISIDEDLVGTVLNPVQHSIC